MPLARKLAGQIAHRPDDIDDLIQEGLFRVHLAFTRGIARREVLQKPYAVARTVMQRGMWGYYAPGAKPQSNGRVLDTALSLEKLSAANAPTDRSGRVLLEEAYDNDHHLAHREKVQVPRADLTGHLDDGSGEQQELLLEQYFTALERACGAQARRVAENLVSPTDPECCRHILDEVNRKRQRQLACDREKSRRRKTPPRGAKRHIRLSQRLVREALGLSKSQWMQQLSAVRQFTRQWVDGGRVAVAS
jgi:hypothetical protein